MRSARSWARLLMVTVVVGVIGLAACDVDDAAYAPLNDQVPPTVSITEYAQSASTLDATVVAEDFISVASVVTELRQAGQLLAVDTTRFTGRTLSATVKTSFLISFQAATTVEIRAVAQDAAGNVAIDVATVNVSPLPGPAPIGMDVQGHDRGGLGY
ncbi:MAG: PilN domain-containing protein [Gemmatimonadota bacterium]|nr:MAG: PilN domain-containing protein [Gemmatimonadota bacterium]